MDSNTLERLVMDRALGELEPDVTVLLDAYLEGRPAERQATEPIARTVQFAREALAEDLPTPAASWSVERINSRLQSRERWGVAGRFARLAACVLIGVGVHMAWTGRTAMKPADQTSGGSQMIAAVTPNPGVELTGTHNAGFWSVKRVYDRAGQHKSETGRRVIWDSPLSAPRLGDST